MVAEQNAAEAALVPGVRVIAADSLTAAADWLRGLPGRDGRPAAVEYPGGQDLPGHRGSGGAGRPTACRLRRERSSGRLGCRDDARSRRDARPVDGTAGRRGLRGRRSPPVAARAARRGQDDAGRADPHHLAQARPGRGARGHVHPFGGRNPAPAGPAAGRSALSRTAPHGDQGGHRRRRQRGDPSRLGLAGAPGRAVPRRGARVRQGRAGRAAPAAGSGRGGGGPFGCHDQVPSQVHAGPGGEPVSVRPGGWSGRGLQLQPGRAPAVPGADLGPAARPGRRQDRARAGQPPGAAQRPEASRSRAGPWRAACFRPGERAAIRLSGHPVAAQRRGARHRNCAAPGRPPPVRWPGSTVPWNGARSPPGAWTRSSGSPGRSPTWPASRGPTRTIATRRLGLWLGVRR